MNKKDILILVALFGLWLLWAPLDRHVIKPLFFPDGPEPEAVEVQEPDEAEPTAVEVAEPAPDEREPEEFVPDTREPVALREPERPAEPVEVEEVEEVEPPEERVEERLHHVETERMVATFSSRGGTIREVVLKDYPEFDEPDSDPIVMDFEGTAALGIEGMAGVGVRHDFDLSPLDNGVRFTREMDYGLRFVREIRVTDDYLFEVRDSFINIADHPLQLPGYGLRTGRMKPMPGATSTYGMFPLGVDTLLPADSVKRWAREIPKWLRDTSATTIRHPLNTPVDWVAVKNKYFVQSLRPRDLATEDCVVYAKRGEGNDPAEIWAALQFPESVLGVGDTFSREAVLYVGPQKLDRLSDLGFHQDRIMELGWAPIRFFATALMWGLAGLYGLFGNYGVAIMLLTVIIRIVFWPLTHKGTESMRRMQELAPLMKELNEKHKDDPQKRQQAVMEMYKEHKVNPLGGCLPMLVQIPVFIGLFYLLRTAIELRFAGFLWISDLSEPEGILGDVLPLPINTLPIFMAVTMFFQQKLTPMPSSGDERQQQMHKMMMRVMPVMMLVLLYNFASGLALYWSTQNVLMIVQQMLYRRRLAARKAAEAEQAASTPPPAPPRTPPKKGAKRKGGGKA